MRSIRWLTVIILILSVCFNGISFAMENEENYFENESKFLSALGFKGFEKFDTTNAETVLTRAEFADIVVRLMGYHAFELPNKSIFLDVPEEHPSSGSISFLAISGVVSASDTDMFRPDDVILFEEAVKMIVSAVGYRPYADLKGGYPSGYIAAAQYAGIFDGVDIQANSFTKGVACKLIYNALFAPVMTTMAYNHRTDLHIDKDKTVLNQFFKIEELKGRVNATRYTALTGGINLGEGQIKIEHLVLKTEEDVSKYLGYYVNAYYRVDSVDEDIHELVYIEPHRGKNILTTVNKEDIAYDDNSFSIQNFAYVNENGKTKFLRISKDADIIYNNMAYTIFDEKILKIKNGNISLLDSDADGYVDVIFVNEYENYVVDRINITDYRIYDKYDKNKTLELDPNDNSKIICIEKDGNPIEFKEINEGDIVSAFVSKNTKGEKIIKAVVSSVKVKGIATSISGDRSEITLDHIKSYKIADNYIEEMSLQLLSDVTLCLDSEGLVASIYKNTAENQQYGYMLSARLENSLDERLLVKLFTLDGDIIVAQSEDKIFFDDGSVGKNTKPSAVLAKLLIPQKNENGFILDVNNNTIDDEGFLIDASSGTRILPEEKGGQPKIQKPVVYQLSRDGKLIMLSVATDARQKGYDDEKFSLDFKEPKALYYYDTLGARYLIKSDSNIIVVPEDTSDETLYGTANSLEHSTYYNVEVYDAIKESKVSRLVIVFKDSSTSGPSYTSSLFLVEKLIKELNEEGEIKYKLSGLYDGKKVSIFANNDNIKDVSDNKWFGKGKSISELKAGDIIQISKNTKDEIESMRVLFNSDNYGDFREEWNKSGSPTVASTDANLYTVFGRVVENSKDSLTVNFLTDINDYSRNKVFSKYRNPKCYVFNSLNKTISLLNYEDINYADTVFISNYKSLVNTIIVIR